jgi:hypothetical protein
MAKLQFLVVFNIEDMCLVNPHLFIVPTSENLSGLQPSIMEQINPFVNLMPTVLQLLCIPSPMTWGSLIVSISNIIPVLIILPICADA